MFEENKPILKYVLLFDSFNFANATLFKIYSNKQHIKINGAEYFLQNPAYYRGGVPVYILVNGYPNSLQLGPSPEFENLIETYPFYSLQAEIGNYVSTSLFKHEIRLQDILVIILLIALSSAITYIITAHAYSVLGIIVPGLLIKRKKPLKREKKIKTEIQNPPWRINFIPPKPQPGRTQEDALYQLIFKLTNAKKFKNIKVYTVAYSNLFVAPYLGLLYEHIYDEKILKQLKKTFKFEAGKNIGEVRI